MKKRYLFILVFIIITAPMFGKVIDPAAPIGSRKNPVPIGKTFAMVISDTWGNPIANIAITVNGIIRGDKAAAVAKNQNMFNKTPSDDYEFIMPMVTVANIKDLTGKDEPLEVDQYMFEFADSGYSHKQYGKSTVIINEPFVLDAKLYEGSGTTGIMGFVARISDECYMYCDGVWFELGSTHYLPD